MKEGYNSLQYYDTLLLVTCTQLLQEFVIGKATFDNLGIYHSLHHFKFLLFRKCREEVRSFWALSLLFLSFSSSSLIFIVIVYHLNTSLQYLLIFILHLYSFHCIFSLFYRVPHRHPHLPSSFSILIFICTYFFYDLRPRSLSAFPSCIIIYSPKLSGGFRAVLISSFADNAPIERIAYY